jgi:transposase
MLRTRNPYPAEFREQIVALARAGRSVEELAREFEPCVATIHAWLRQADREGGYRRDGLTSEEHDELCRLCRENRQLRQERDILAKAAAWFAQSDVTCSIPPSNRWRSGSLQSTS